MYLITKTPSLAHIPHLGGLKLGFSWAQSFRAIQNSCSACPPAPPRAAGTSPRSVLTPGPGSQHTGGNPKAWDCLELLGIAWNCSGRAEGWAGAWQQDGVSRREAQLTAHPWRNRSPSDTSGLPALSPTALQLSFSFLFFHPLLLSSSTNPPFSLFFLSFQQPFLAFPPSSHPFLPQLLPPALQHICF